MVRLQDTMQNQYDESLNTRTMYNIIFKETHKSVENIQSLIILKA